LKSFELKSELILLLTAAIWGFAFVAQRAGMEHVGPFIFNAVRFALGALVLVPFILVSKKKYPERTRERDPNHGLLLKGGLIAGIVVFFGSSLQQAGLVYTTAGKAGFITGLYVIIVPIMGLLFWKQRVGKPTWLGAALAVAGLYLLSFKDVLNINPGDGLVFLGSIFWALHVLVIGKYSPHVNSLQLALIQFSVACILSLVMSLLFETTESAEIGRAAIPILYAGIMSTGVAFTFQVIGQRRSQPSRAAIIMSFEAVFAVIGGIWLLKETLSGPAIAGCILMLTGILLSTPRAIR